MIAINAWKIKFFAMSSIYFGRQNFCSESTRLAVKPSPRAAFSFGVSSALSEPRAKHLAPTIFQFTFLTDFVSSTIFSKSAQISAPLVRSEVGSLVIQLKTTLGYFLQRTYSETFPSSVFFSGGNNVQIWQLLLLIQELCNFSIFATLVTLLNASAHSKLHE